MFRGLAIVLLAALLPGACADGCSVLQPGVRLLEVRYSAGDGTAFSTYYEDPDARRAPDVWDYLATVPVMADDAAALVPPDADDPLRATLRGGVGIEVLHAGRSLRRQAIPELTLIRPTAADARWHLTAEDTAAHRPR